MVASPAHIEYGVAGAQSYHEPWKRDIVASYGGDTSVILQLYVATYPRSYQAHVGRLKRS